MNPKSTWVWTFLAAILCAAIFIHRQYLHHRNVGSRAVLPGFNAAAVSGIQIFPRGQKEIRADVTNGVWRLAAPLAYSADTAGIGKLLSAFEHLRFATYIPEQELQTHAQPNEE